MQRHDDRRKQWIFHGLLFFVRCQTFSWCYQFSRWRTVLEFALEVYILPPARPQTDQYLSGAKWFADDK